MSYKFRTTVDAGAKATAIVHRAVIYVSLESLSAERNCVAKQIERLTHQFVEQANLSTDTVNSQ